VVETANTGNSKTWLTPYYDRPFVLLGILTATSGVVSMIFTNDVGSKCLPICFFHEMHAGAIGIHLGHNVSLIVIVVLCFGSNSPSFLRQVFS